MVLRASRRGRVTDRSQVRVLPTESLISLCAGWYNSAMGKRSDLGELDCPYCDKIVKKVHPWQKCCGTRKCRNALIRENKAPSRKHYGKTFTCDECGEEAPRTRSNQRFCTSEKCQHVSKFGKRKKLRWVFCSQCGKRKARVTHRQVTCLRPECVYKQERETLLKRNPPKRTGKRPKCRFCKERFTKLSSIHVTCNKPECAKKQKAARADESYELARKRKPKLCLECNRPIQAKRFRYHPKCRRKSATERRRMQRAIASMKRCPICDELVKDTRRSAHAACRKRATREAQQEKLDRRNYEQNIDRVRAEASVRSGKRIIVDESHQPRMEKLKCERQLQRTS